MSRGKVAWLGRGFGVVLSLLTLLVACSLNSAVFDPRQDGDTPTPAPTATEPGPTGDPSGAPVPSATPAATVAPTSPWIVWLPPYQPLPPTTLPQPTTEPTPPPPPPEEPLVPTVTGNARPTRIVVPALNIDLAIVKGDSAYPLCNVAQIYPGFVNPGQPGTTYLYGHARRGMFLPLLNHSLVNNGADMIGMLVKVYTADKKLHLYRINIVKRHAVDWSLAKDLKPGQHRLIMQTSEGLHGTIPKLMVAAKPIGVYLATAAQALPTPHPVKCGY